MDGNRFDRFARHWATASSRRRLLGFLAGTAVGAVGLRPRRAAAASVSVFASSEDWTPTGLFLQHGQQFSISYLSGTWTVASGFEPFVGPEGYPEDGGNDSCKYDTRFPYGRLIGFVGAGNEAGIFSVGRGGVFDANGSGQLYMGMNEAVGCEWNNDGSVRMDVGPYSPPPPPPPSGSTGSTSPPPPPPPKKKKKKKKKGKK